MRIIAVIGLLALIWGGYLFTERDEAARDESAKSQTENNRPVTDQKLKAVELPELNSMATPSIGSWRSSLDRRSYRSH